MILHRPPPEIPRPALSLSLLSTCTMLSAEPVDTIQQQQHHNIATDSLIEDVNLTVIQHPYLDELADKIRTEPIPWQVRHTHTHTFILLLLLSIQQC